MHQCIRRSKIFSGGGLIYQLTYFFPSVRNKQIPSSEVGQLAIDTVLDSIHYKLNVLENRVLVDSSHIHGFKLAFETTLTGTVTTHRQLNKTNHSINCTDNNSNKITYMQK